MNIFKETTVLLNIASDKTKYTEGKLVFYKMEKHLIGTFDKVDDNKFERFKNIVPLLTRAEIICLKAYLTAKLNFYTIDGPCTGLEEQYVDHWHGIYRSYSDALNEAFNINR